MSNEEIINPKPKKKTIHYEGRETEEWWWGGKSSRFDSRIYDTNPDDEELNYEENVLKSTMNDNFYIYSLCFNNIFSP